MTEHRAKIQPYVFDLGKGFDGEVPVDNFALHRRDGVRVHLDVVSDRYLVTYEGRAEPSVWFDNVSDALRSMADLLEGDES